MNLFLSNYIYNIDKKSRVSVPSAYRDILNKSDNKVLIAYPSFRNKCIELCSAERLMELSKIIQTLDPYSDERDAFETIILGEAVQLNIDNEGRIILPPSLLEYAGIIHEDKICFVGKGLVFEIWNPKHFEPHLNSARKIAKENRLTLKNI